VRWILEIDGEELSDADVREDEDRPHLDVVSLVRGDRGARGHALVAGSLPVWAGQRRAAS
jgi:hypothetical protein